MLEKMAYFNRNEFYEVNPNAKRQKSYFYPFDISEILSIEN
jgi:hypothetical protein